MAEHHDLKVRIVLTMSLHVPKPPGITASSSQHSPVEDTLLIPGLKQDGASLVALLVESACHAGDPGSIPGLGSSPGEGIGYPLQYSWASLVAQLVKNLPAMWETWV